MEIESDPPTRQEEVKKEEVREIKQDPTEIILQHSLAALLAEKTAKHPINAGYCDLLSDLIHHAQQTHHHELTELLIGEIEAIGTQRQTDCAITQYIERRKQLIQQLGQHLQPFQKYQACLKLQETSLAVVELILKYRAKWEDLYWQQLAAHRRVHFHHQGSNYLTQMASEVHQLASAEVCDPFLIATTARLRRALQQPSNPELTLRLRACELLLIEEDLLA